MSAGNQNRTARFRIRYTFTPPPKTSWVADGDQDGEPWEGDAVEAANQRRRLQLRAMAGEQYEVVEVTS